MVSIKELTWSSHARIDRQERMLAILMTVGFGEICYCKKKEHSTRMQCFTDTGCLLIVEDDVIITGYVASYNQMTSFFSGEVPSHIRKAVSHSNKMIERYMAHI